ncbi:MAG TPA: peroxiredoxin family protein [Candidatus Eisenbacteria bacterium]|jgi:peroxiredoxin Q/BCP
MRIAALCLLVMLATPASPFAQGSEGKPTPVRSTKRSEAQKPVGQLRAIGHVYVGERAPDFELTSSRGRSVVLSKLRGDWVLLNFAEDRRRFSELRSIRDSLAELGVVMLGVCRDQPQALRTYAQRDSIPFELLADPTGEISALYGLFDFVHTATVPGFIVLDRRGVVRLGLLGQSLPPDQVAELVRFTITNL